MAAVLRCGDSANEIALDRPFYPYAPGGKSQQHLIDALNVNNINALRRQCELPNPPRGAACPLFWTLGGNQVGKGAISGWQEVLVPALALDRLPVMLWPFAGELQELTAQPGVVIAETYPGETYGHLGMPRNGWSKRQQAGRQQRAQEINQWCAARQDAVVFSPVAQHAVDDGFGPGAAGEDAFDAIVGLCGMLDVVLGHLPEGAPNVPQVRNIEGWILGQQP